MEGILELALLKVIKQNLYPTFSVSNKGLGSTGSHMAWPSLLSSLVIEAAITPTQLIERLIQ